MDALDSEITTTVRGDLLKGLGDLEKSVDEQTSTASDALRVRLTEEVSPKIKAGMENANANNQAAARSELDAARKTYACILAEDLRDNVASEKTAPYGILQADWGKLVENVRNCASEACSQNTDPDHATMLYQEAYSLYLKAVIGALRKRVQDGIASVKANAGLDDDVKKDLTTRLNIETSKLDGATSKLRENRFREAFDDYTAARNEVETIAGEVKQKTGVQMSSIPTGTQASPVAQPRATISAPVSEQKVVRMNERTIQTDATIGKLSKEMKWFDFFFMIVVLCVSLLLGLKLLWVDDPTWGGAKAYLAALLWGLGLYQVSGAAFVGVSGLIEKWSK